eukprot:3248540-Lingulodinium_polyedra.AAC.1
MLAVEGNEEADRLAKEGAAADANFGRAQALQEVRDRVLAAAGMMADLHLAAADADGWGDTGPVVRPARKPPAWRLELVPGRPHAL